MGEISSELKQFKSSVEPNIGSMNSVCTDIVSKIQDVSAKTTTAKSGIDNYYSSNNKNTVMKKFDRIGDIYSKISSSVDGDLKGMISDAQAIVDLVTQLEDLNKEIAEQESIVRNNSGDSEEQISKRSSARSIISQKNIEFNQKHIDAINKLNSLKGKDSTISFVSEFSPSNTEANPEDLQYGSFEQRTFTASNGLTIKYWLYVPDYGKEVEGLPVMLYMHGGSTHQSISYEHAVQYGLGSKIAKQEITPSGVVIVPCVEDFSDRGVQALKELTDSVVEEQNCDTDRISVSGHSYGGITSYKLINSYPDYFSCCVAISGRANVTSAFSNMKVWSFNGTYENGSSWTSYGSSVGAVKEINALGGEAYLTPIKTGHSGTNKMTYERTWTSPDGIEENPLDWAFRQEKA